VFSRIGHAQEKKITKIFISSSNPKNNIAAGMTTGGGIGRSISMVTSSARRILSNSPMKIPSGMNRAAAKA
jgi:hypothetical protein